MDNINLDDFDPDFASRSVWIGREKRSRKGAITRPSGRSYHPFDRAQYVHAGGDHYFSGGRSFGVDPDKLRDWRALERRTFELTTRWRNACNLLWSSIREAAPNASRENRVVICIGNDMGIEYDSYGYSTCSVSRLAERLVEAKGKESIGAVVSHEVAARFNFPHLMHADRTLLSRANAYKRAFESAVNSRLLTYVEKHCRGFEYRGAWRFKPTIVVLQNEDRRYVIALDETAKPTWHIGNVVTMS